MTDLTEQWKKGELPNGIYYVELLSGNTTIAYMYKMRSCKKIFYRVKSFKGYISKNQMKAVLSEVPSYEEWQAKNEEKEWLQNNPNRQSYCSFDDCEDFTEEKADE